jgi:hypothetical protein
MVSINAMYPVKVVCAQSLKVDTDPICFVIRGTSPLGVSDYGIVCTFASETQHDLREEAVTAFAQKPLNVLDMLLLELSLVACALTVLVGLVWHGHGDLGEIAQVSETANYFKRAEDIFLQQSVE